MVWRKIGRFAAAMAVICSAALPAGAADEGQVLFNNACRTCHSVKAGDNRLGPTLHAVVGRPAGTIPGYGYSSALKDTKLTWDKSTLDRFIADPNAVAPGNSMKPYGGLTSERDRAAVIAYLESAAN
jgi:cytochrome c